MKEVNIVCGNLITRFHGQVLMHFGSLKHQVCHTEIATKLLLESRPAMHEVLIDSLVFEFEDDVEPVEGSAIEEGYSPANLGSVISEVVRVGLEIKSTLGDEGFEFIRIRPVEGVGSSSLVVFVTIGWGD